MRFIDRSESRLADSLRTGVRLQQGLRGARVPDFVEKPVKGRSRFSDRETACFVLVSILMVVIAAVTGWVIYTVVMKIIDS